MVRGEIKSLTADISVQPGATLLKAEETVRKRLKIVDLEQRQAAADINLLRSSVQPDPRVLQRGDRRILIEGDADRWTFRAKKGLEIVLDKSLLRTAEGIGVRGIEAGDRCETPLNFARDPRLQVMPTVEQHDGRIGVRSPSRTNVPSQSLAVQRGDFLVRQRLITNTADAGNQPCHLILVDPLAEGTAEFPRNPAYPVRHPARYDVAEQASHHCAWHAKFGTRLLLLGPRHAPDFRPRTSVSVHP